jgi:hypothetical protein
MAVADYFRRATVAAAQAIAGFDEQEFHARVESRSVGVTIGKTTAKLAEGQALLDMTVRLAARLYPSLVIVGPDETATRAAELARAINPRIDLLDGRAEVAFVIGKQAPDIAPTRIYMGSRNWDARVSANRELSVGRSSNPLGAGAAACFAAANMFRLVVVDQPGSLDRDLVFSTLEMTARRTKTDVALTDATMGNDNILVGAGAIGNAAIWSLARAPVKGALHIVDGEAIELSNLQRYVLADRSDEMRSKVQVAIEAFQNASMQPHIHAQPFAEFVQEHGYDWQRALVAVDTAAVRQHVQASLPRWIVNAWTQPGDLGVSTHQWRAGACLACLYLPQHGRRNEDELVAEALGLHTPDDRMLVRKLLWTQQQPPPDLLERIATALDTPLRNLEPYAQLPLRSLYTEGLCGGAAVTIAAQAGVRRELHVPLAHQSALAGVLLASRAVAHAIGASPARSAATRIDLLRPVPETVTTPVAADSRAICLCFDDDYRQQFDQKYKSTEPQSADTCAETC